MVLRRFSPCSLALASLLACSEPRVPTGVLALAVLEASTGEYVPARLEIRGPNGRFVVPEAALDLGFECILPPAPAWAAGWTRSKALENPNTGTTQFYAAAPFEVAVPAGASVVRDFRGI
jgi:hypothetical protein